MKQKLPNQLTILRIFMIPIFLIVLYLPKGATIGSTNVAWIVAAVIFAVASFTDWLDGYLARKWHVVSNFGKFADPLADKMLTMTAFVMLIALNLAPAWLVAIIVCRELAVTGLRLLLVEQGGTVLAAAMPGKIKTFTQMLSIIFLLIGDPVYIGTILLYVCLVFTIYSGYDYFAKNMSVFKNAD
ncbi:MAG: CDP-diacylglycerol--glycerol-3-phosphate 3-phosphatidyltransferase [Streptococcaceae bacterium]|uniref:CDP-diacylglycerol--glycerol-3-phosphate 3-phosphatidyltransferase n=1 Tax=Lactococcus allomyrinae TaxID=2419773 RepID=A0A387BRA2_9LACT|nr:CDP-diacylglycerol--glycerol-3-phosphate 3-phosphatidyltransferase [Lactococcus allomyrinae]AYG01001.1 CDP-diacylglycerol--glycerol-3-phosphate 3-phosphatidyltransferase [Lactococcus allomyrinae]MCL2114108.1 CDP-diacylglycerol--glycerol-3-phosphate 3-phosphatidyltransferase [Streptococcaceae bacterium]